MRRWTVATILSAGLMLTLGDQAAGQDQNGQPGVVGADTELITVGMGQSMVIETPWPAARVSITQPDVADVQILTPQQLLLTGSALGTTDLIIWSDDEQIWHTVVDVVVDLTYIDAELDRIFPACQLEVMQSKDMLIVSGQLRRNDQVEHLHRVLDGLEIKYVDMTHVAGVQQVMLTVRIAEVSREAIRALGVNYVYGGNEFFGASLIGSDSGGAINPIPIAPGSGADATGNIPFNFGEVGVSSGVTLLGGFPKSDLQFFLQALAENQYVRILAEPTLIAHSGEEASFLAGGEFPIPVVQGSNSAGGGSSISIEYKEYGVRLAFQPTVLGDGSIRLHVAPEVSELTEFGAVLIEGFSIPAVLTRRAETTLELKSGQTFTMAGLLRNTTTARRSRVPLLGDLPVLGPLFRSVRYVNGETELVVLVTASLVEPSSEAGSYPVPGDTHMTPDDWELFAEGRIEGRPLPLNPADRAILATLGLDRLKGPGAWTTFEQRPVPMPQIPVPDVPMEPGDTGEAAGAVNSAAPSSSEE